MFTQAGSHSRRIRASRALGLVLTLALLFSPLRYLSPVATADDGQPVQMKVQPLLLEQAAEDPTALVDVIVQQGEKGERAEALVAQLGGVVTKDLHLISAFAAQIPAGKLLELAQAASVRWISLDAPLMSAPDGPAPDVSVPDGSGFRVFLPYISVSESTGAETRTAGQDGSQSAVSQAVTVVTNDTLRDEFNTVSFANNNGTLTWTGPWQEKDPEAGGAGPSSGQVQIVGGALRLDDNPDTGEMPSAARHANLTAATSAALSFDYRTTSGVDPEDAVVLEVSNDSSGYYTVLDTFTGISGATGGSRTYSLSGYISADTVVRFRVSSMYGATDEFFYVDNIQIALSSSSVTKANVRDEFNNAAFDNNNGTAGWSGAWVETDPEAGGAGAAAGQVQVVDGGLRLDDNPDTGGMPSAARHVNLSGAISAVFTFDFHTTLGVDPNDYIAIEVSANGGASFTALEKIGGFAGAIWGSRSYEISSFISADTVIRFLVASMYGAGDEYFYADNVQVQYALGDRSKLATSVLTAQPTQVHSGDLITVYMTLSAGQEVAGVAPSALAVQGTNGIGATLVSGPTPASTSVGPAGRTFTWVYRATDAHASGALIFSGNASGGGMNWPWQHTGSIHVDPVVQAPVTPPDPVSITWAPAFGEADSSANPLAADFNGTAIAVGKKVWFNAVIKPSGLGAAPVKIRFFDAKIGFTADGRPYEIAVPEGTVLYSPTATAATTTFDSVTGSWLTTVPSSYSSEAFVAGVAYPVTTALPASIKGVTWTGRFTIDTPGVSAKWKWGAAVYSNFSTTYQTLGVKPISGDKLNPYANSDKAGAPENSKTYVIKGARGNGGTDYTGSWCAETTATLTFHARDALVNSPIGPDGIFAYGSKVFESLAWFEPEINPGYVIQKVEAVLQAYVPAPLGHDFKLKLFVGGSSKEVSVKREFFDGHVGPLNTGPIYIDLTGLRTWQWADFDNGLELVIDQSALSATELVYYDAVGLRVTSAPGTDVTGGKWPTSLPKAAIDLSKLTSAYQRAVRATDVWNQAPAYLQGQGVSVAVVDSGVYKSKDLANKRILANVNFNRSYHNGSDTFGHGTFVAATIAGDGSASRGGYMGVAPKTNILNVRVSNDQGVSTEADVIEALQWVKENKAKYNIRVVNLSLNARVMQSYLTSPLDAACEALWFSGIVVVVSAGNNGTAALYPPANDPFVITVGATDDNGTASLSDDVMASFSAYGSVESGGGKPDLVAPGRNIIAYLPRHNQLRISNDHPRNRVDNDYFRMSGTSMAAPMVTAAVAMLLQDEPNLTPDQVKYRLKATANKSWPGYDVERAGAGYLDIYAAVNGTSTAKANAGIRPHRVLALMAVLAVYATYNSVPADWGSVNWDSVNWDSVNWDSVNWDSVNWDSVNWDSVNWDSVNWDSVNWDSVNWDSVNWDSVNWDSVNWDSVNWDSVNWDSVNWDSVNWDSVDWGSDYWGN